MPLREIIPTLTAIYRVLGRVEQRQEAAEDLHRAVLGRLDGLHQRVTTLEQAKPGQQTPGIVSALSDLTKAGKELAKAISSAREWTIGATVVLSSLYAQINPEAVHTWLSKLAHWVSGGAP